MNNKKILELQQKDPDKNPRQLRADGYLPVTVYGKSCREALSLKVNTKNFQKDRSSNPMQVIDAMIDGSPARLLIKSIEKHPVTDQLLNVRFQKLAKGEKITITVPIIYTGQSPLVQAGGSLFINKRTVTLACLSENIPSHVEFNLSFLADSCHIAHYSDLQLSDTVSLNCDPSQIITKVSAPQVVAANEKESPQKK